MADVLSFCPFPLALVAFETPTAFVAEMKFRKRVGSELDALAILRTEMQRTLQRAANDLDWSAITIQGAPVERDYAYRITIPKLSASQLHADDARSSSTTPHNNQRTAPGLGGLL